MKPGFVTALPRAPLTAGPRGTDGQITPTAPTQHPGVHGGAGTRPGGMHTAAYPSPFPSVRAAHQSKAPSPFTPPAFIKHVFKAASAELILSTATNGLCVPAIANGGTAAERARRWVFPFPGASTGEQRLRLLSLVGGFPAAPLALGCIGVGDGTAGAQQGGRLGKDLVPTAHRHRRR